MSRSFLAFCDLIFQTETDRISSPCASYSFCWRHRFQVACVQQLRGAGPASCIMTAGIVSPPRPSLQHASYEAGKYTQKVGGPTKFFSGAHVLAPAGVAPGSERAGPEVFSSSPWLGPGAPDYNGGGAAEGVPPEPAVRQSKRERRKAIDRCVRLCVCARRLPTSNLLRLCLRVRRPPTSCVHLHRVHRPPTSCLLRLHRPWLWSRDQSMAGNGVSGSAIHPGWKRPSEDPLRRATDQVLFREECMRMTRLERMLE